jgi:hypothetical protein
MSPDRQTVVVRMTIAERYQRFLAQEDSYGAIVLDSRRREVDDRMRKFFTRIQREGTHSRSSSESWTGSCSVPPISHWAFSSPTLSSAQPDPHSTPGGEHEHPSTHPVPSNDYRWGRLRDFDTTAGDGQFDIASDQAQCRRGERLISGGVRARRSPDAGPLRVALVDSGPVTRQRQWFVTMNSDLGGAACKRFVVFAYCLAK